MKLWNLDELPPIPKLKLAVIGHVEWVSFLALERLPQAGLISHAKAYMDEPAGGGAVAAVQLSRLIKQPVHFFTSLGKDWIGEQSLKRLEALGVQVSASLQDKPTRRGVSLVDSKGERAITIMGERLNPRAEDKLPWDELVNYDGVFITAADTNAIKNCRKAKILVATPRVGIQAIKEADVKLDALIGSGLDPDENMDTEQIKEISKLRISTKGSLGGTIWPGGDYKAVKVTKRLIDSYGCGDSFAAAVMAGLASGWTNEKAISLGAHVGAACATHFGPFTNFEENFLIKRL